ncbi:unnamed protein product [Cuscuta campestris]|uniref:Uncharacterized protein n=1 Tax=Cuscuta campestris TaxID=132261 RepID=A0A484L654_9ASTE|nr:unnamed protein product [Cuscuta campestris]
MRRRQGRTEKKGVCAVPFKRENATGEMDASFLMMNKELQTRVGDVKKIDVRNGGMKTIVTCTRSIKE